MGARGAALGLSWTLLGALLGHLGANLRRRMAIGSEKARRQNTLMFFKLLKDLGILEASSLVGSYLDSWSSLGAVLGVSWSILEAILKHLGLS